MRFQRSPAGLLVPRRELVVPPSKQRGFVVGYSRAFGADPYFANVVLLAANDSQADGSTSFDDQSSYNRTITAVGNVQYDTAQAPTGTTSSALFDGAGDRLVLDGSGDFAFGSGDFTVEIELQISATGVQYVFYDSRPTSTNGAYVALVKISTDELVLYVSAATRITGTTKLTTGQFYHVELGRSGSETKLFLNGTQEGSTYSDATTYLNGASRPVIGADGFDTADWNLSGWGGCIRVTKGVCRHTANFTPPSLPLPAG